MAQSTADTAAGLREGFAAYARGDYDAVVETFHADIEIVPLGGQAPIWGRKAVREWLEPQAFAHQILDLLEVRVEGNAAVTRHHTRARGAKSGIEVEFEMWGAWTFDDAGLVVRWEMFALEDRDKAFAAAGIANASS
jgi:ketosteroid isomerase-like protein